MVVNHGHLKQANCPHVLPHAPLCVFAGAMSIVGINEETLNPGAMYLWGDYKPSWLDSLYRIFTYQIMFANFIPISLLVTMDEVKFGQSIFMQLDNGIL